MEGPVRVIEAANNPFRGATTITYSVPVAGMVRLAVYDLLGCRVAVLVDEERSAGSHAATLDASIWPDGVYKYRLEAGDQFTTGRLVRRK